MASKHHLTYSQLTDVLPHLMWSGKGTVPLDHGAVYTVPGCFSLNTLEMIILTVKHLCGRTCSSSPCWRSCHTATREWQATITIHPSLSLYPPTDQPPILPRASFIHPSIHLFIWCFHTLLCKNLKHCWLRTSTNSDSKSWSLYQAPPVTERSGCRLYNMYTFFLDACRQRCTVNVIFSFLIDDYLDTYSHWFHSFNEFFAFQILQDFIDFCQREVALEANVSAPDPCSMERHETHHSKTICWERTTIFPLQTTLPLTGAQQRPGITCYSSITTLI